MSSGNRPRDDLSTFAIGISWSWSPVGTGRRRYSGTTNASRWWRDKRIQKLQEVFQTKDVALAVQEDILKRVGIQEPEVIERFERVVFGLSEPQKENADALLDIFVKTEDKLRRLDKSVHGFAVALFPLVASAAIGSFFVSPVTAAHVAIWIYTLLTAWPFFAALREPKKEYLGEKELAKLKRGNP
jgi:hypothetical protein